MLRSRALLEQVTVSDDILGLITDICAEYQVDGLRGDIVMYKTASTIAAYDGRTEVDVDDVREAALLALLASPAPPALPAAAPGYRAVGQYAGGVPDPVP